MKFFLIFFIILSSCAKKTSQDFLDLANKEKEQKNYIKSLDLYEKAYQLEPNQKVFSIICDLLIKTSQYKKAGKELKKLLYQVETPKEKVQLLEQLISLHELKTLDTQKEFDYLKLLVNFRPKVEDFLKYEKKFLELSIDLKKDHLFIDYVNKLSKLKKYPLKEVIYKLKGTISFKNKKWDNAIKYWNLYLANVKKDNAESRRIRFLLANVYETISLYSKARSEYLKLQGHFENSSLLKERLSSLEARRYKIIRR